MPAVALRVMGIAENLCFGSSIGSHFIGSGLAVSDGKRLNN
jgi:hypothetical protein